MKVNGTGVRSDRIQEKDTSSRLEETKLEEAFCHPLGCILRIIPGKESKTSHAVGFTCMRGQKMSIPCPLGDAGTCSQVLFLKAWSIHHLV